MGDAPRRVDEEYVAGKLRSRDAAKAQPPVSELVEGSRAVLVSENRVPRAGDNASRPSGLKQAHDEGRVALRALQRGS